jgi:endoglucanase
MNVKKTFAAFTAAVIFAVSMSGCSKQEEPVDPAVVEDARVASLTAQQVTQEMGNGTNLGNTMDAVSDKPADATVYDYEQGWGAPITTEEMIVGMKEAGFGSVRIPCAWSNMMSDDGTYTINEQYFLRMDQIIGYVLDNDMYAIVNIHWDNGWWDGFGDSDEAVREETMKRYKTMWQQIAEHYKDYSHKLILESANEELGDTFSGLGADAAYEKTNEINQTFVDLVRATGGNNADRCLLIAGYNTDIDKTVDERFVMPTDTVENKLMVSVHYYTPSTYCIASSKYNSWGYMDSWGTDEDKAEMRSYFEKLKRFIDEGYGVVIGEYGVCTIQPVMMRVLKDGAADFFAEVLSLSEEMGYCPMLWDTGEIFNRTDLKMKFDDVAQVYLDAYPGVVRISAETSES